MDNTLIERIKDRSHEGEMPCIAAHTAAWETKTPPARIGQLIDQLELRISHCQLGLFGYGPKEEGKSKLVRPMQEIDPQIKTHLESRAKEDRISCLAIWDIADKMRIERLIVGNTADAMGLKIAPCQLGAF